MGETSNNREKRRHPRFFIDLPAEYRDMGDSCLRGAIVVNASEGGFLIETVIDIPLGTELSITLLYPKGFELVNLKVLAKIVWKEPDWKEDLKVGRKWKEYRYGLKFTQISDEDRLKLKLLLGGRSEFEEISFNPYNQHLMQD
jgi:hypothetical protein